MASNRLTTSHLEPERRLAALHKAGEAHERLAELRHEWLLVPPTRSDAQQLGPILTSLSTVMHTLSDGTADHWDVAAELRSAESACEAAAHAELGDARRAIQSAYELIAA